MMPETRMIIRNDDWSPLAIVKIESEDERSALERWCEVSGYWCDYVYGPEMSHDEVLEILKEHADDRL